MKRLIFASTIAMLAACHSTTAPEKATVEFAIVAPLCSSVIPAQFSVDGVAIGVDTFRVDVAGPRTLSRGFAVSPGVHMVGARVPGGYIWADTQMTLVGGRTVTDSLPYYCS